MNAQPTQIRFRHSFCTFSIVFGCFMTQILLASTLVACNASKTSELPQEETVVQPASSTSTSSTPTPTSFSEATTKSASKKTEDRLACVRTCIKKRQAEAVSADLIEQQCLDGCTGSQLLEPFQIPLSSEKRAQEDQ